MHRTQIDGLGDQLSLDTGLLCCASEDRARQEFKDDADVNVLLRRYGVLPVSAVDFGEVDYGLDLQGAYAAVSDAQAGWNALPVGVRSVFGSLANLVAAIDSGRVRFVDGLPVAVPASGWPVPAVPVVVPPVAV